MKGIKKQTTEQSTKVTIRNKYANPNYQTTIQYHISTDAFFYPIQALKNYKIGR